MSEPAHLVVVQDAYEAAKRDGPLALVDRYGEWFSPDFIWRPILLASLDGRTYTGEAEFREYWAEFLDAFEQVDLGNPTYEAVDGERVLLTAELHLTGAGSGFPINRTVAYLFEVRDGQIIAARTFFSPADAREFLADA